MKSILLLILLVPAFLSWGQNEDLMRLAEVLSAAGRYGESNGMLDRFVAQNPNRLFDKGEALFLQSFNYLQLGDLDAARESNTASLQLRQQFVPEGLATNYLRFGEIYLRQGQFERALSTLFRAEEFPMMDDPQSAALIKERIGEGYFMLQQYEHARQFFQQSLDILSIEEGEDSPGVSANYIQIGQAYFKEGRLKESELAYKQSMDLEEALEGGASRKGQLWNALGQLAEQEGKPEAAKQYYSQALIVSRSEYPAVAVSALLNLAHLHISRGAIDEAKEMVKMAVGILCPGFLSEKYSDTPSPGQPVLNRLQFVQALELKASISLQEGQQANLELALASSLRGIEAIEEEVEVLAESANRLLILDERMGIYEKGMEAAYRLFQQSNNTAYAAQAFEISERARALGFRLNRYSQEAEMGKKNKVQEEVAGRRYALRSAELSLARQPDAPLARQQWGDQKQAFQRFMGALKAMDPDFYFRHFGISVAAVPEIQQQLDEKTALLSYYLGDSHYYVFVLTSGEFQAFRFEGVGELTAAADAYLGALQKEDAQGFTQSGNSLYEKLIRPLSALLKKKDKLLVIPHGLLCALPLEGLLSDAPKGSGTGKFHKLDYLAKTFVVQYAPSASVYSRDFLAAPGVFGAGLLAFAPVFDQEAANGLLPPGNAVLFDTTYQHSRSLQAVAPDGDSFVALPGSGSESERIAGQFSEKGKNAIVLSGREATEQAFKTQAGQYRYLHLATHGFSSSFNPAITGIAFSQLSGAGMEDGILFAGEIPSLQLKAELVVLRYFQAMPSGEGLFSIALPFLETGVPNLLIASGVNTGQQEKIIALFYEALLKGASPGRALHQARQQMMADKETAAPWNWVGVVLVGR